MSPKFEMKENSPELNSTLRNATNVLTCSIKDGKLFIECRDDLSASAVKEIGRVLIEQVAVDLKGFQTEKNKKH